MKDHKHNELLNDQDIMEAAIVLTELDEHNENKNSDEPEISPLEASIAMGIARLISGENKK